MSKKETETAVALVGDFNALALFSNPETSLAEILEENVGSEISAFDLPKLTVPSGGGEFWTVQTAQGSEMVKEIEGVIVHVQHSKTYWSVDLDSASEVAPPDCSSDDGVVGVGDPGGNCRSCPMNEFGSKGKGKACRDRADVFVVFRTGIMPTRIQVPATSLAGLRQYGMVLLDCGKRISDVLTRFTLATETKSGKKTAVIKFQAGGEVSGEVKEMAKQYKAVVVDMLRRPIPGKEDSEVLAPVAVDGEAPFDS